MSDEPQTPRSPIPKRPFNLRDTDWLNNHSRDSSGTSFGDEKSSFYTYESRETTPDVDLLGEKRPTEEPTEDLNTILGGVGRLPDDVYDRAMPWWRSAFRRRLFKTVEWESKVLANMQVSGFQAIFQAGPGLREL